MKNGANNCFRTIRWSPRGLLQARIPGPEVFTSDYGGYATASGRQKDPTEYSAMHLANFDLSLVHLINELMRRYYAICGVWTRRKIVLNSRFIACLFDKFAYRRRLESSTVRDSIVKKKEITALVSGISCANTIYLTRACVFEQLIWTNVSNFNKKEIQFFFSGEIPPCSSGGSWVCCNGGTARCHHLLQVFIFVENNH